MGRTDPGTDLATTYLGNKPGTDWGTHMGTNLGNYPGTDSEADLGTDLGSDLETGLFSPLRASGAEQTYQRSISADQEDDVDKFGSLRSKEHPGVEMPIKLGRYQGP